MMMLLLNYLQLVVVVGVAVVVVVVEALASFYQCNILVLHWDTGYPLGPRRRGDWPMHGCICPDIRSIRPSL
jgi:hypothetical protein